MIEVNGKDYNEEDVDRVIDALIQRGKKVYITYPDGAKWCYIPRGDGGGGCRAVKLNDM